MPVSFYQLKELRWLDLKNNPLVPTLAEAAGNCLDAKECHEAAKKVVKLMAMVHSELEKKRIQDLEEEKGNIYLENFTFFAIADCLYLQPGSRLRRLKLTRRRKKFDYRRKLLKRRRKLKLHLSRTQSLQKSRQSITNCKQPEKLTSLIAELTTNDSRPPVKVLALVFLRTRFTV